MTAITLTVNGRPVAAEVEPRTHLADFLRETLNLTGTHTGCEHGVCGACTILLDGVPVRSCITLTVSCENAEVRTIEDLDGDEIAAELRAAFSRQHGLQCGYCTPGMIVSARDVVLRLEGTDERDIRVAMSGNLCRCTGYVGITQAITQVIAARRSRGIAAVPDSGRTRLGPAGCGHPGAAGPATRPTGDFAPASSVGEAAAPALRLDGDWQPQTTLVRSFRLGHPQGEVLNLFGDVAAVASCLPGAAITGIGEDGHVDGRIRVRLGPIATEFRGAAVITRDDGNCCGTIEGRGVDNASRTATRGRIAYAVRPGERAGETRVDLEIGFTVTGVLAQFSRAGIVEDVAERIIAVFVDNLERRLSHRGGDGGPRPAAGTELDAGSLLRSMAATFIREFIRRLFGGRR